ncbi:IS701 family transposase [Lentzea alba]|uniref:IS701 family transposase n=1 Tax=Lentzea alba TaxID=2714351 RepID=UPI0039BF5A83
MNFGRAEPRRRMWTYLLSLPSAYSEGRRNGNQFGTYDGEQRADGVQRLLTSAQWDEEAVRNDLRALISRVGGASGGALFVSEVAFPKKGSQAVAVERQYCVETEKHENCQIGIILSYFTASGQAFVLDRELYLPKTWAGDAARRKRAGIPEDVVYRSKSVIAAEMIERTIRSGIVPRWVGHAIQCPDKQTFRRIMQRNHIPHVMAVTPGELSRMRPQQEGHTALRALGGKPPVRETLTYGSTTLAQSRMPGAAPEGFGHFHVVASSEEQAHYLAFSKQGTKLAELAQVVEVLRNSRAYCSRAKQEIGLGYYEVRSWRGWYRHITLVIAAYTAMEMARSSEQPVLAHA